MQLTIGNTDIGSAAATVVPFTIAGLDGEDTGTVTFTDGNSKTVQVNVSGSQTNYIADLSSLADGTITSSLAVNTDLAGNTFTAVTGNAVTLDTDKTVSPVLSFVGSVVDAAADTAWPVTISGLDDETGTLMFTDTLGHSASVTVTGNGTYSANLSSLSDGSIASSLSLSDPVGNHWSLSGSPLTLVGTVATNSNSIQLPSGSTGNLGMVGSNGPTVIDAALTHGITFQSGNGPDTIIAGPNDTVHAGNGPDTLIGATGATLYAGSGQQNLYGAPGETMVGGNGVDTFVLDPGFGKDTIINFHTNNGTIQFNQALFASYSAVLGAESFDGHSTTITYDANNAVTLQNIAPSSLHSSNFQFT